MVLTDFFELKGYSCKDVLSGLKGLEVLNRNTPKMILLDVILNDISGYEICNKIKSNQMKILKKFPFFTLRQYQNQKLLKN
jgi:DNA-binding response OmpR family regulator